MTDGLLFLLLVLATGRMTEFLYSEEGPFQVFERFRTLTAKAPFLGPLFQCYWCLSVWVAMALAAMVCLGRTWPWWVWLLLALAASAGAMLWHELVNALQTAHFWLYYKGEEQEPEG